MRNTYALLGWLEGGWVLCFLANPKRMTHFSASFKNYPSAPHTNSKTPPPPTHPGGEDYSCEGDGLRGTL